MKYVTCSCPEKTNQKRLNWRVAQYKCNHSAFNGYAYTESDYSEIRCLKCYGSWRTKAAYVENLIHLTESEKKILSKRGTIN